MKTWKDLEEKIKEIDDKATDLHSECKALKMANISLLEENKELKEENVLLYEKVQSIQDELDNYKFECKSKDFLIDKTAYCKLAEDRSKWISKCAILSARIAELEKRHRGKIEL